MPSESAPAPDASWRPSRLFIITLVFGAIASVVSLCLMYGSPFTGMSRTPVNGIGITFGPLPFGQLYALEDDETRLAAQVVTLPDGSVRPVLDRAVAADGFIYYLLLTDLEAKVSQVFRVGADGSSDMLTQSATLKYNLFLDRQSSTVVYEETQEQDEQELARAASNRIMLLAPGADAPVAIGSGNRPALLPGARSVILLREGKLMLVSAADGSPSESSLDVMLGSLLAVNEDASEVAIYNSRTHAVDLFRITESANPFTYVRSVEVDYQPTALGFMGGRLWTGQGPVRDDTWNYVVRELEGREKRAIRIDSQELLSSITHIHAL